MTPAEVIAKARELLQDTREPYRYPEPMLLGFVNQTLLRMAVLRPDLFAEIENFPTEAGSTLQTAPADSIRVMEVFRVVGGGAITEVSRDAFDKMYPGWGSQAAAPAIHWMRHVRNANRFFVYPAAPEGQQLLLEYAKTPPTYGLNDEIVHPPEAHFTTIIDGVVFLAESIDNEHVNEGRAALFQQNFTQALTANLESRIVTDTEQAGLPDEKVVAGARPRR